MLSFLATLLERARHRSRARECLAATEAPGAVFLPQARVFNFQNRPDAIRLGEQTHIRGELLVFPYGGKISLGKACYLGEGSRIWSDTEVEIGDHVLIAHHVSISDTDGHELEARARAEGYASLLRQGHARTRGTVKSAPVRIGAHAWINHQSCILKGVTIGEGAIVGCGSVVTKDIPPYTLAAGNPARVLRELER